MVKNLSIALMCAAALLSLMLYKGRGGEGPAAEAPTEQAVSLWRMTTNLAPLNPPVNGGKPAPGKTAAFKDKSLARGSDLAPKLTNS
jgi:hypothetical protein